MTYSLVNELDGSDVAGEIVMLRAAQLKSIFIIEGGSDEKLWTSYVDNKACDIVIGNGKYNAINALRICRDRGINGILVCVDVDFDAVLGQMIEDPDVIYTVESDVEILLIQSGSFDKLLTELGSATKISALIANGKDIREVVRDTAYPLGLLRYYSLTKEANLKFEDLRFGFVDNQLKINLRGMIDEVCNNSRIFNIDKDAIAHFIDNRLTSSEDRWSMCNGHDVATIIGRALRSLIGSQNAVFVSLEQIESRLRSGYEVEYLRSNPIYPKIRAWEQGNLPFRILH